MSRFCQGQKGCSPGYIADNFGTKKADAKGVLRAQEYKTWKKLFKYNIEMLYILKFQVLSMFSAKFLILSRFSHLLGQIPGYFWNMDRKNSNLQVFQVLLGTLL